MADPPSPTTDRPEGGDRRASSSGALRSRSSSRLSVPPSEPRSSRASFEALDAQLDRPARLQMMIALVLVLVLVVVPLYLWRRPRATPITASTGEVDAGALPTISGASAPPVEQDELTLGAPKILSCHDPGPKKTPPEQCDHVTSLESAFARAIEQSLSCVPKDAGGGTIIYVADVNYRRRLLRVGTPKEGRTLKSPKIAAACRRAVKAKLAPVAFEANKREHARYRVSITATYPAPR